MIAKLVKILAFLLLVSCGQDDYDRAPDGEGWDDDLRAYTEQFVSDAEKYGITPGLTGHVITMRKNSDVLKKLSKDFGYPLAGICLVYKSESDRKMKSYIYILEGKSGSFTRFALYHELTHCAYELDHFGEPGDIAYDQVVKTDRTWDELKQKHFTDMRSILEQKGVFISR